MSAPNFTFIHITKVVKTRDLRIRRQKTTTTTTTTATTTTTTTTTITLKPQRARTEASLKWRGRLCELLCDRFVASEGGREESPSAEGKSSPGPNTRKGSRLCGMSPIPHHDLVEPYNGTTAVHR